jgi:hypothetical protein
MAETTTDFLLRRVEDMARAARERRITERDYSQGQERIEFQAPVQEQLVA